MVIDSPRKVKAGLGIIAEIYRESETRELGWRQVIDAEIFKFLRLMAQDCRPAGETAAAAAPAGLLRRRHIVEKVKAYIQSNSDKKLSLDDLTKVVYLSPYYLSRMFKAETGFSPIQYLINTKIGAAKGLLRDPDLTISQIADQLGYESIHYFSRLFTAVEGISPSLYRAKLFKTT
jgi:AraC-like DNA-binding protein